MKDHIDELRAALRRARRLVRDLEKISKAYAGGSDDDDDEIDVTAREDD